MQATYHSLLGALWALNLGIRFHGRCHGLGLHFCLCFLCLGLSFCSLLRHCFCTLSVSLCCCCNHHGLDLLRCFLLRCHLLGSRLGLLRRHFGLGCRRRRLIMRSGAEGFLGLL